MEPAAELELEGQEKKIPHYYQNNHNSSTLTIILIRSPPSTSRTSRTFNFIIPPRTIFPCLTWATCSWGGSANSNQNYRDRRGYLGSRIRNWN